MARPEVTAEQKQIKREAILRVAREVFAEKGFHATGIADIAQRLDVGHGTIYRYFENKLDIFLTIYDGLNADFLRIARGTRPDLAATVNDYIAEMQRFYTEFGGVLMREINNVRIFFDEVHADPEIKKRFDASQGEFQLATERFITIGREKGFIRTEIHIPSAARILNAMIFDTMRASSVATESPSNNLLLLAMTVMEIFNHGALAKPA